MANINAKMVGDLKKQTGAGLMDCKKALVEADGDVDKAIKILREKGLSAAAKKADRIAADGLVDIMKDGDITAMVEVNTETDFVAKNATFQEFVKGLLRTVIANRPATIEALSACKFKRIRVNQDGRVLDCCRPVPHIKGNTGVNGMSSSISEIRRIKIVILLIEQFFGLLKILDHKLI
jgi:translation elongation factor Ts